MTSRRISVAKTLTWRVIATATTFTIAALVTNDLGVGLAIGGTEAVAKMGLYYAHERAWTAAVGRAHTPGASAT